MALPTNIQLPPGFKPQITAKKPTFGGLLEGVPIDSVRGAIQALTPEQLFAMEVDKRLRIIREAGQKYVAQHVDPIDSSGNRHLGDSPQNDNTPTSVADFTPAPNSWGTGGVGGLQYWSSPDVRPPGDDDPTRPWKYDYWGGSWRRDYDPSRPGLGKVMGEN